jgi:membrane protease YdiL (CAAX protease family)
MNTPASREGNIVRYVIYLVLYWLLVGWESLAAGIWHGNVWGMVFYLLLALFVFYFLLRRFNREQVYFDRSHDLHMLDHFWLAFALTVLLTLLRLALAYMKINGHLHQTWLQVSYNGHENVVFFWLLLVIHGCLLAGIQQYIATGFFFNYFFRDQQGGILALVFSGLIFSLLNFSTSISVLALNFLLGMLFAWSYLYTHSIVYPLYLAMLNGVLQIILF